MDSFIDSFANRLSENVEIINKKITNNQQELFGVKPISVAIEFNSEAFVEKAGNKFLFKVGELIGKQTQMSHFLRPRGRLTIFGSQGSRFLWESS